MKYVALCLLAVLVAGCGGAPQPTLSTGTPTISSATTSAPVVETPQQFLRRWVRAIDVMERAGNPRPWQRMNAASCKSCGVLAAVVKGQHRRGWKVHSAGSRLIALSGKGVDWRLDLDGAPTRIVDQGGTVRGQLKGGEYTLRVQLRRLARGWLVANYYEVGHS